MAFRIKPKLALDTEVARVKGILLLQHFLGRVWDSQELRAHMADVVGCKYTDAQWTALNDGLHTAGIVEDVV